MATVILSAVGFALGGPIGAAIGSIAGQQIDRAIFAPKGQLGPRLNDLKLQTSTYGTAIPKVFGTMRLSGTVIWATDLRETRQTSSNGKGQPKTTTYSYSASFAVALSARAIVGIGRIWADGKLLRGVAGDFKTKTGFRLHNGSEGQGVDPLISAAEGASAAPAYRGIAYAVFEDFQLADYGNHIPSLSFEIIGDNGPVSVGDVIAGVTPSSVVANCPTPLQGFAAYGDSIRAVCQSLQSAVPFHLRIGAGQVHIEETGPASLAIPARDEGASTGQADEQRTKVEVRSASTLPARLTLSYADSARDYQAGTQQARRDAGGRREETSEIAATLDAAAARTIVERRLASLWSGRARAQVSLPWRHLDLAPGATLSLAGRPETWRIESTRFERMVFMLDLVRVQAGSIAVLPAAPGRNVAQSDLEHGATILRVLDLPPLDDGARTAPLVAVAACGAWPGWRGAALLRSVDAGLTWQEAGATAAPAIMGVSTSALAVGADHMFDALGSVDVELFHNAMTLGAASDDILLTGGNAALLGNELIQFGAALPLGGNRYRLSRLLRGRRGTPVAAHGAAEPFTLLDRTSLAVLDVPPGTGSVRVNASGVGDVLAGVEAAVTSVGRALVPLPPVHLRVQRVGGDDALSWIRSSRDGWRWLDGVDLPLAEERVHYRVTVQPNVGPSRSIDTDQPLWLYTGAARAADLSAGATAATISVVSIGIYALSAPTTLSIPLF